MRNAPILLLSGLLALGVTAFPDIALAQTAEAAAPGAAATIREARVTFATQSTVYIDAGTLDGLAVGDVVEILRSGGESTRLEVMEASAHKAACRRQVDQTTAARSTIEVRDLVRYGSRPADKPAAAKATGKSEKSKEPRDFARRLHDLGLSGRIGARYMMLVESGSDYGYNQPGLDVRLRGRNIAGSRIDTDVDVRAYRSYRDTGGDSSTDASTRVYRANVAWSPETVPMRLVLGRQFSPSLANLSLFDGALAQYDLSRFSFGVLGGTQPDADDYGLSGKYQQYGTWAEMHNRVGAEKRWAGTLGFVGSYDGSEVDREFLYLQGRYDEKRGSLFVAQELDINRSWKKDAGEDSLSATSTHANGRLRINDALSLSAGVDNRRNVQLYRDYVSPETDFDDDYRSGYWVRIDGRLGWFRSGFDVRFSRGGDNGDVDAYSVHVGAVNVTPLRIDVRSRTTRYDGDQDEGWLQSFTARAPIGERVGLTLLGGLRDETSKIDNGLDTRLGWYGVDIDVTLGQHWLYLLSVERNQDDDVGNWQLYTALSYRF